MLLTEYLCFSKILMWKSYTQGDSNRMQDLWAEPSWIRLVLFLSRRAENDPLPLGYVKLQWEDSPYEPGIWFS